MKDKAVHRILEVGMDLILKQGYKGVGLNKILSEADIPKGSFYYYFKSKEDFGLQVIEHYSKKSLAFLESYLLDRTKTAKQRIITFFEDMRAEYGAKNYSEGCLLGNCSIELSDYSEKFSVSVASGLNSWQKSFEKCILEGQEAGNIKTDESAEVLSDLVLTTWEGALLRMKSSNDDSSIITFIHYLDKYLL